MLSILYRMRVDVMIAVFDDFLLGVVMDENVVDVTPLV